MKRLATFIFLFALVTGVFQPGSAWAGTAAPGDKSPGASVATAISTVTGVAISPLLGTAAVGCYKYMGAKTEKDKAALPWFARPYFFIPAGLVVCLCALKDVFGIAIPGPLCLSLPRFFMVRRVEVPRHCWVRGMVFWLRRIFPGFTTS